jgi:tetracycline 7-halogenase / FADH2 O2-dependent halogenase
MRRISADVLILGAGFAGSLLAWLLQRQGRQVVLVDRSRHPRFAIGESSTPLADLALRQMGERYDLPDLVALSHYGSWKESHPKLACGLKRGFSYFQHQLGKAFSAGDRHADELLVAASVNDSLGDTHWLRADVDHWFARSAAESGAMLLEGLSLTCTGRDPWQWDGTLDGEPIRITAPFVVDGTGPGGVLGPIVGAQDVASELRTWSRAVYAHVEGLPRWQDVLAALGESTAEHPFPCDAAALHHLVEEGWLWQLRFDNDVTSLGLATDAKSVPDVDPETEFRAMAARYPSLAGMTESMQAVAPRGGWQRSGRLQRGWAEVAGGDWVMLPHTAGFIDPLHSSGIAHSLFGVETLAELLGQNLSSAVRHDRLQAYARRVRDELRLIDHCVAACYATRASMPAFVAATMLYFAAATCCEARRLAGRPTALLAADDPKLMAALLPAAETLIRSRPLADDDTRSLVELARRAIAPWNTAGLLDPEVHNMYRCTALPAVQRDRPNSGL